ncbi:MAG: M15 family metallopeptidase [Acidimicrobiales bacterium]
MIELHDPGTLDLPLLDEDTPVPMTTLPGHRLRILDNGEALVVITGVRRLPAYESDRWPGTRASMVAREGVVSRLKRAERQLARGFGLVVLDAWRTQALQHALYSHYYSTDNLPSGYVSNPGSDLLVPPHTTGGALDITLRYEDWPLKLGTEFDGFGLFAASTAFERAGMDPKVRNLRRMLARVLWEVGFYPHPMEWWHYSYGDQVWAHNAGKPAAIYGAVNGANTD